MKESEIVEGLSVICNDRQSPMYGCTGVIVARNKVWRVLIVVLWEDYYKNQIPYEEVEVLGKDNKSMSSLLKEE